MPGQATSSPGRRDRLLRTATRWVSGGLVNLLLFAVSAELLVRFLRPAPRAQIIRAEVFAEPGGLLDVDAHGTVFWRPMDPASHVGQPCDVPGRNVLLIGDSIFYGSGLEADEVVSEHLRRRLEADGEAWCVRNEAVGAFAAEQKLATLRRTLPEFTPDLVLWQAWGSDAGRYVLIGRHAFQTAQFVTDDKGWPLPVPVPEPLRSALWRYSHAWNYAALALTPLDPDALERQISAVLDHIVPDAIREIRETGADLLAVMGAPLDQPFEATLRHARQDAASPRQHLLTTRQRTVFEGAGVTVLSIAELLADHDVDEVALDPCCHLNPTGHEALAAALEPLVRAVVERRGHTARAEGAAPE